MKPSGSPKTSVQMKLPLLEHDRTETSPQTSLNVAPEPSTRQMHGNAASGSVHQLPSAASPLHVGQLPTAREHTYIDDTVRGATAYAAAQGSDRKAHIPPSKAQVPTAPLCAFDGALQQRTETYDASSGFYTSSPPVGKNTTGPYRKMQAQRSTIFRGALRSTPQPEHNSHNLQIKHHLPLVELGSDSWAIMPHNPWYLAWWGVSILACYATAFYVPLMFGFSPHPVAMPTQLPSALVAWSLFGIFFFDTLLNLHKSFYNVDKQAWVTNRHEIRLHYVRRKLWLDLLGLLPFDIVCASALGVEHSDHPLALYISALKWLNMARLYRVLEFFLYIETKMAISYTLMFVHWGACAFYWVARLEDFSPESWVGQSADKLANTTTAGRYTFSLYWSITTVATVGYGDFAACTTLEAAYIVFFVFCSIFLLAYVTGSIITILIKGDERTKSYRDRMRSLLQYTHRNNIPQELHHSMTEHLELQFTNADAGDETVLAEYPATIRRRVLRHLYVRHLQSSYLFVGCKPKFLDALLAAARVEVFMPTVEILAEGDHVTELYIIVAGAAAVHTRSGRLAQAEDVTVHASSSHGGTAARRMVRQSSGTGSEGWGGLVGSSTRSGRTMSSPLTSHCSSLSTLRAAHNELSVPGRTLVENEWDRSSDGGYTLYEGDSFGDIPFFTEVNSLESVRAVHVVRVLVITRAAYAAVASDFPLGARLVLDNLQRAAEEGVMAGFSSQACLGQSLLKPDMLAQLCQVAYSWGGQEGYSQGSAASMPGASAGLLPSQKLALGDLLRIRNVVTSYVAKMDDMRTNEWLYAATLGDTDRAQQMLMQGHRIDASDYDDRTALMLAAAKGHKNMVKLLLEAGADAELQDTTGHTAMLEACKHSHDDVIQLLLQHQARLNIAPNRMAGLLCTAVSEGDTKFLSRLLRAGAPLNSVDYDQRTALHIGASEGNLNAVKILLEAGASVEVRDRWDNSPLDDARRAAAQPVVDHLEALVSQEVRLASLTKFLERRAGNFLQAVADGNSARVQALLEQSCPPDVADYEGRTGLLVAAAKGRKDIVDMLLMWGANPLWRDRSNSTALLEACVNGHDEIIEVLLSRGVQLELPPVDAASRLCVAVSTRNLALLKRLLNAGLSPMARDYDARTPLHVAAAEDSVQALQLMVEYAGDASLSERDRWGNSPLDEALGSNATSATKYLQECVPEAAHASAYHKFQAARATKFLQLASTGDPAAVRGMLQRGCPPDVAGCEGRTALMVAAAGGDEEMLLLLLRWGADPSLQVSLGAPGVQVLWAGGLPCEDEFHRVERPVSTHAEDALTWRADTQGCTALLEACKAGHDGIIKLLTSRGDRLMTSGVEAASLLCKAVHSKEHALLRRLLLAGLLAASQDYDLRSAAHVAASEENVEALNLLLAAGGTDILAVRDRWGNTVLDEAKRVGSMHVVSRIQGAN